MKTITCDRCKKDITPDGAGCKAVKIPASHRVTYNRVDLCAACYDEIVRIIVEAIETGGAR